MPPKKLTDRTYFKHEKEEKTAWKKKAKKEGISVLSHWIRNTLNAK